MPKSHLQTRLLPKNELTRVRDRVQAVGGTVHLDTTKDAGTTITLSIPVEEDVDHDN